ncbi:MAG: hypothetical protein EPN26_16165 [Rhodospirillales bacterium]|nr:MAG: hypothetical protein EPN26_16165 [Rhodospirillales bacterium]
MVNKKKNFVANFLFWMTLVGLSTAAFSALLAITTIAVDFTTTKIITVWQPLTTRANPCAPTTPTLSTARQGAGLAPQQFTTFQMDEYTFDNPGGWQAQVQPSVAQLNRTNGNDPSSLSAISSNYMAFLSPAGTMVATLHCPAQEIGYPLAHLAVEIRQFERNGVMHTAILRHGLTNAQNPAAGRTAFILVQPVNILEGYETSCQILATPAGAADVESIRRVYLSLR